MPPKKPPRFLFNTDLTSSVKRIFTVPSALDLGLHPRFTRCKALRASPPHFAKSAFPCTILWLGYRKLTIIILSRGSGDFFVGIFFHNLDLKDSKGNFLVPNSLLFKKCFCQIFRIFFFLRENFLKFGLGLKLFFFFRPQYCDLVTLVIIHMRN